MLRRLSTAAACLLVGLDRSTMTFVRLSLLNAETSDNSSSSRALRLTGVRAGRVVSQIIESATPAL